jgi:hypothetical protein
MAARLPRKDFFVPIDTESTDELGSIWSMPTF